MSANNPACIERELTLDILRGAYAAGSRLPTVRELAESYSVTPATIQRAVARLETRGLVTARQGSGIRVNDPRLSGDVSLVPYWIEAALDDPAQAAAILDDFLEVRRVIAARLIVRHRERVGDELDALMASAGAMYRAAGDVAALREADLGFARLLLRATGNTVALAVLNTGARVLELVPAVAEAMYSEPASNASAMLRVLQAVAKAAPDLGDIVERALAEVDGRTVARFEALLRQRRASP